MLCLAWLILLVRYIPKLPPAVPKNAPEADNIWQESQEFVPDFKFIRERAQQLYNLCCEDGHGGPRFAVLMCHIETWAWDTVQRYQDKTQRKFVPGDRRVSPVCMCNMHFKNPNIFYIKAAHAHILHPMQSNEEFYRYPFIDTDD